MKTNWYELAVAVGSVDPNNPYNEHGGDSYAQDALDEILGYEWIVDTVEYAISSNRGAELAMNCLRYLHSEKACLYAYEVYKSSIGERARMAVWLIKHLANKISYTWVEDFLNDKNVIDWGLGVLDQLLWGEIIEYDENVERLLQLANNNSEGGLDERIQFIREYLYNRFMRQQHYYAATITWTGNKGEGTTRYDAYERAHTWAVDGKSTIACSSDTPFRGDGTKHNPEDALLYSLSSCHMLWYLHLCADAGIIVTDYTDNATGVLSMDTPEGARFTEVTLLPVVTVADASMIEKANQLHDEAHKKCFIAKSVNFPVKHEPKAITG